MRIVLRRAIKLLERRWQAAIITGNALRAHRLGELVRQLRQEADLE